MTTSRFYSGIIGLLVAFAFFGCVDHRLQVVTPGAKPLRVKTITQQLTGNGGVRTVSAFSYDGQGRLTLLVAYQLPDSALAPVEHTVYQYDAQNRLTQVTHATARRGSNQETYTLTYNGMGQLAQMAHSPSTFSLTPQYNTANQVSTYDKSIAVSGLFSTGRGSFTFTRNNLTATVESFSVSRTGGPSGSVVYSRSTNATYTFDDKVNPFYGNFIVPAPGVFIPFATSPATFGPFYTFYGGIDNPFNMSQNNVLTVINSTGATTVYKYNYNTANLPTTRTTTTNSSETEILQYEYESY